MTDEANALVERARYCAENGIFAAIKSDRAVSYAELVVLIETQAREIERLREALEHIGIYGCGMLNQPAAMNGPEEIWLKQRIFEMERTARAALGDSHDA